jgi:hypothetical protein
VSARGKQLANGRVTIGGEDCHALAARVQRDPRALLALQRARQAGARAPAAPPPSAPPPSPSVPPSAVTPSVMAARTELTLTPLRQVCAVLRRALDEVQALCAAEAPPLPLLARDADVLAAHCRRQGLTVAEARDRCRDRERVTRRDALVHALHDHEGWSPSRVARALGRDHATVLHALKKSSGGA